MNIYSASFGDTARYYMRGQLTVLRNTPHINSIWKRCKHFSDLTVRIRRALDSYNEESRTKGWPFQSSEGCFSRAVASPKNISVMVASIQLSDAFRGNIAEKESILVGGGGLVRCYEGPLINMSYPDMVSSSEKVREYFATPRIPRQQYKDSQEKSISVINNAKCSYWVHPEFQVCLASDQVHQDMDVLWTQGGNKVLGWKTNYDVSGVPAPGRCREGMVVHFQGWKRLFIRYTTRLPSPDAHLVIVSAFGMIPLRMGRGDVSKTMLPPLGYAALGDSELNKDETKGFSEVGLHTRYSIFKRKFPESQCLELSETLNRCLVYATDETVSVHHIVRPVEQPKWANDHPNDRVTLLQALPAGHEGMINAAKEAVLDWHGGAVLVVAHEQHKPTDLSAWEKSILEGRGVSQAVASGKGAIINADNPSSSLSAELLTAIKNKQVSIVTVLHVTVWAGVLPVPNLLNLALAVAPTDNVMILPAGVMVAPFSERLSHPEEALSKLLHDATATRDVPVAMLLPSKVYSASGEEWAYPRHKPDTKKAPTQVSKENKDKTKVESSSGTSKTENNHRVLVSAGGDSCASRHIVSMSLPLHLHEKMRSSANEESFKACMSIDQRTPLRCSITWKDPVKPSPRGRWGDNRGMGMKATASVPVAFNRAANQHGHNFVRFPEELSGPFCHGLMQTGAISGAGYSFMWVPVEGKDSTGITRRSYCIYGW